MISNAEGVKNSEYIANANSNKHLDTMTTNDAKVNSDELVEGNKYLIINQCVDGKEYIMGTYAGGYGNLKKNHGWRRKLTRNFDYLGKNDQNKLEIFQSKHQENV